MTPVYEVKTKHTDDVLRAFIKFSNGMNHGNVTFRLCLLGFCFGLIGMAFRGNKSMYVWMAIGIAVILFALFRTRISFAKLAKNDPNYQNGSGISFLFGHSEFEVKNDEKKEIQHLKYGEITGAYKDKEYYYISVNNEDLHILPLKDFTMGSAEAFDGFLSAKIKKDLMPVNLPLKEKFRLMKLAQAERKVKEDQEWAEWKAKKKK